MSYYCRIYHYFLFITIDVILFLCFAAISGDEVVDIEMITIFDDEQTAALMPMMPGITLFIREGMTMRRHMPMLMPPSQYHLDACCSPRCHRPLLPGLTHHRHHHTVVSCI